MFKFRLNNLPINRELLVALKEIYGLGWSKIKILLSKIGFSYISLVGSMHNYYKDLLFFYLENFIISKARIDRIISLRIKRLIDLKTYKGSRHILNLPVHGQRTRTNANTQRSKRFIKEKIEKLDKIKQFYDKKNKKK